MKVVSNKKRRVSSNFALPRYLELYYSTTTVPCYPVLLVVMLWCRLIHSVRHKKTWNSRITVLNEFCAELTLSRIIKSSLNQRFPFFSPLGLLISIIVIRRRSALRGMVMSAQRRSSRCTLSEGKPNNNGCPVKRKNKQKGLALRDHSSQARSYRRVFFPLFPKFGNTSRYIYIYIYVSICGGLLPLLVKFSRRSKNMKFVKFHIIYMENKIRITWKIEKLREKNVEIVEKMSPIRMSLIMIPLYYYGGPYPGRKYDQIL